MSTAIRVNKVVKCKIAALCKHPILASDHHVVCIRCKLLSKAKLCNQYSRCVECQHMSIEGYTDAAIVLYYYLCGVDTLRGVRNNCNRRTSLTYTTGRLPQNQELMNRFYNIAVEVKDPHKGKNS